MLSRLVRRQLVSFVIITTAALCVMGVFYVKIPQLLGVGRFPVSVDLSDAGGLYPKAAVTYRGYEVGEVISVDLRDGGGVTARLQIDDGTKIAADSVAQVRSMSVIGEQYLNFEPPAGDHSSAMLSSGATVPVSRTQLPTTTTTLFDAVDNLTTSIPRDDLRTVVDELGKAFDGSSASYGRLIDASSKLEQAATQSLPQTLDLIDQLEPVLGTQQHLDPAIRRFATGLDTVTGEAASSDADLRNILVNGAPVASALTDFLGAVTPVLSPVLSDLDLVGNVLRVYMPAIEHVLIVLPALESAFNTATPLSRLDDPYPMANLSFKIGVDPPPCTAGFSDAYKQRNPDDLSVAPIPQGSYCKASATSQLAVRGARNDPCPHDPSRRSASAAGCGYIFDQAEVDRARLASSEGQDAQANAGTGSLLAPNGLLFLLDPVLDNQGGQTWQSLLLSTATSPLGR